MFPATMRCYPWVKNNVALMGDSAHAVVPFYGQGMNAGFEDCTVMDRLMKKHNHDWDAIFQEYSVERKPDGDALQDLSVDNYFVMRDYVADPAFILRKKIEAKFSELHPDRWLPLYSQVTFSNIRFRYIRRIIFHISRDQRNLLAIALKDKVWRSRNASTLSLPLKIFIAQIERTIGIRNIQSFLRRNYDNFR